MRRLRLIDTLYLLGNVQTISLLIFVSITSIGCIWQFISLVQLYLTYPTTVQIDTQFDVHKDSLAAFSLCRNTFQEMYNHTGRSTDELFDHYSKLNVVDKSVLGRTLLPYRYRYAIFVDSHRQNESVILLRYISR